MKTELVYQPGVGMVAIPRRPRLSKASVDRVAAALYEQWAAGSTSRSKTWDGADGGSKAEFCLIAVTAILAMGELQVEGKTPWWRKLWWALSR